MPYPQDYFVRVKDNDTRAEYSLPATASRDGVTVLDKPAADDNGDPLPAKTSVNRGPTPAKAASESPQKAATEGKSA